MASTSSESYDSSDSEPAKKTLRSAAVVVQRPSPAYGSPKPPLHEPRGRGHWVEKEEEEPPKKKRKEEGDALTTRTGGAYIPPARLRMMQEQVTDKSSVAYQRLSWEALKKSINGLVNKVNVGNIAEIIHELFQENIVRGRGLLARSIITAQAASPTFTPVYAALVAIINTKFPQIGELIASRLVLAFRRAFKRNDKNACLSSVRFIAHLVNQQVLHELLALELLTLLLEDPTNDSVEVAIGFLKECGEKLTELAPRGLHAVFESLKGILHDGSVDVRVQYMIEVMFAVRKDRFSSHPAVPKALDLVDEEDNITHLISVEDELQSHDILNVFQVDDSFLENEQKYLDIKAEILGTAGSDDEAEGSESSEGDDDEDEEDGKDDREMDIQDETHTNLLSLRRTIYLTIMSSLDYEECVHKLLKMEIKPGQEMEMANMIIECCSQERSYQRFYGLLGERFCHLNQLWVEKFDAAFQTQYTIVHRLETNKLRNVAKFFAQLFYTDALPWTSLSCVHLNEEETNSSSRIFVKIMFQELAEYMGLPKLNQRLKDKFLSTAFEGLFPRDNPRNTRFAINFFTSIGLGGLTDDLREHLKNAPKMIMSQEQAVESSDTSSSSESESESSDDSSSTSDSSSSDPSSESSEESRNELNRDTRERLRRRERESHRREQRSGHARTGEHERKARDRETRQGERRRWNHRSHRSPEAEVRQHRHRRSPHPSPRRQSPQREEERQHRHRSSRSSPRRHSPRSTKRRSPKHSSRSPKHHSLRSPKRRSPRSPKRRPSRSPKRRPSRSPKRHSPRSPKRRSSRSPRHHHRFSQPSPSRDKSRKSRRERS